MYKDCARPLSGISVQKTHNSNFITEGKNSPRQHTFTSAYSQLWERGTGSLICSSYFRYLKEVHVNVTSSFSEQYKVIWTCRFWLFKQAKLQHCSTEATSEVP